MNCLLLLSHHLFPSISLTFLELGEWLCFTIVLVRGKISSHFDWQMWGRKRERERERERVASVKKERELKGDSRQDWRHWADWSQSAFSSSLLLLTTGAGRHHSHRSGSASDGPASDSTISFHFYPKQAIGFNVFPRQFHSSLWSTP